MRATNIVLHPALAIRLAGYLRAALVSCLRSARVSAETQPAWNSPCDPDQTGVKYVP